MALSGMNIGQIRNLDRYMSRDAADINRQIANLGLQIESAPWSGNDRERFTRQWRGTHVAALRGVVSGIESESRQANEYAHRQEEASRAR